MDSTGSVEAAFGIQRLAVLGDQGTFLALLGPVGTVWSDFVPTQAESPLNLEVTNCRREGKT